MPLVPNPFDFNYSLPSLLKSLLESCKFTLKESIFFGRINK